MVEPSKHGGEGIEEPHYYQAALLQWREGCKKSPLFFWKRRQFGMVILLSLRVTPPSVCLQFSSRIALYPLDAQCSAFLIPAGKFAIWLPGGLFHDWSK